MSPKDKPLVWLDGIGSPPFSREALVEAGYLLRRLQQGEKLALPHSETMPEIGPRSHQLRIRDNAHNWRIVYRIEADAILVVLVFAKTTKATPRAEIETAKRRLKEYDKAAEGD